MSSIKLAVVAGSLSHDPREAARLSREMGFAGVQFDAYGASLRMPDLSLTGRREFRQMITAQNQLIVSLRVDLGSKGFGPGADVDRLLNGLDRAMETATGLGVGMICVDVGILPEPAREAVVRPPISASQAGLIVLPESFATTTPDAAPASPPPDPAFVSQVNSAMGELGSRAERYSIVMALRTDLSSYAALNTVMRSAGCPWFGVDLDPTAVLHDEWSMDDVFTRLGDGVRHVRGRDALGGAGRRTKPAIIGRGDTQWRQLLSNLQGAGYAGWTTIDPIELPDRTVAAAEGLKHLRSLV
jgi:sugar phosphate isomerase/epimerase